MTWPNGAKFTGTYVRETELNEEELRELRRL